MEFTNIIILQSDGKWIVERKSSRMGGCRVVMGSLGVTAPGSKCLSIFRGVGVAVVLPPLNCRRFPGVAVQLPPQQIFHFEKLIGPDPFSRHLTALAEDKEYRKLLLFTQTVNATAGPVPAER